MKYIFKVIILNRIRYLILFVLASIFIIFSCMLIIRNTFLNKNILQGKKIVIDPGHGGIDGGANNKYILEKDVNLDVALRVKEMLENKGAQVIMTRTEDVELSGSNLKGKSRYIRDLNARTEIINNSGAHMFISIHTNSNVNKPSTRGAIAFYYNSHPHNRDMAYIFQNLFNTCKFTYEGNTYTSHHIPQKGKYYILENAKIPGIIVETGFITNSTDLFLLKMPEYRSYLADVICQGIAEYFVKSDKLPQSLNSIPDIEEETIIDMSEEDKEH